MSTFDSAFAALMVSEGGYSNHPADPGGETMFGVTKRVAVANGYAGAMLNLPLATAKAIAKKEYWDRYQCDSLPDSIAFQIFDCAYNGGKPVQWLQMAAGVIADGSIGPVTIAAVNAADPEKIIMRFNSSRLRYLAALPTWPTFGRGWANRIADNLAKGAA